MKKPELTDFLYKNNNLPDTLDKYSAALKKYAKEANFIPAKLHADVLNKYRHIRTSGTIEKNTLPLMNSIYRVLVKEPILFKISGRIKSIESLEEKLLKCEDVDISGLSNAGKDILGFRIVIYTHNRDCAESVSNCYKALNIAINTLMENGYFPVISTGTKDTEDFNPEKHPLVYVPEKTEVPEIFRSAVKDYIFTPKSNGYQSLHVIFDKVGSKNSNDSFELQIRTIQMDHCANQGKAQDRAEKLERKGYLSIDYSKINMPGFLYFPPTEKAPASFTDDIGILDGLGLDNRNRTNFYLS